MPSNQPDYQEDQILILDTAIELMKVPHSVVSDYQQFVTNEHDERVEYGDPAACKFCVAGVVEHAAMVVRMPGKVLSETSAYFPIDIDEAKLLAEACQVSFHEPEEQTYDRPEHCETLVEVFDKAWRDGDGGADLELVRESVVQYLQRGRDHIAQELSGVGA